MKEKTSSFWEWQKSYPDDAACLAEIAKLRWPEEKGSVPFIAPLLWNTWLLYHH